MPRSGPRKIQKYSTEFKLTAVKLSQQPGLQVQAVAHALEIHPYMLSKWRKDLRDGSEYSGAVFRDRLRQLGVQQSSALHGPGDNAHMESFFHSLKAELLHGTSFATDATLRQVLRRYIQYYNRRRLHSALDYRAPVDYESLAA